jgi:hypothetical protein
MMQQTAPGMRSSRTRGSPWPLLSSGLDVGALPAVNLVRDEFHGEWND